MVLTHLVLFQFIDGAGATTAVTPTPTPTVTRTAPGGFKWEDHVSARNRELHLKRLLAKARKKVKALVKKSRKLEVEIQQARREEKPIEGILVTYERLSHQIAEQKVELKQIKFEHEIVLASLPKLIAAEEEDDDEDILLLL